MIPTEEQLLDAFAAYNALIWPMQIVAYVLGIAGLALAIRKNKLSSRLIPAILAFLWLWVALLFWFPSGEQGFVLGYLFAGVYLIQGLLFLVQAFRPKLAFEYRSNLPSWAGIFFVLYALVGYPLISPVVGHVYPQAPPFGLTPCPLVAFTFGLLLLTAQKVPKALLLIPLFYAFSGFLWVSIGMVEDTGMVLSGLVGIWLIWKRDSRLVTVSPDKQFPERSKAGWSLDISDQK